MGWNLEQEKELAYLWNEGKGNSEIGRILGRSKNSIVGKLYRMRVSADHRLERIYANDRRVIQAAKERDQIDLLILQLREDEGLTFSEIDIQIGVSGSRGRYRKIIDEYDSFELLF